MGGALDHHVAYQAEAFLLQLLPRTEEVGVVGHVEHSQKPHAPGVGFGEW